MTQDVSSNEPTPVAVSNRPDFLAKVIYGTDLQPLPERVAKGARMLDMKRPNWYRALDPTAIDMAPDRDDIVSVLYGDYLAGISNLGLPAEGPVDHGYTLPATHDTPRLWEHLTRLWRHEIVNRQRAVA